MHAYSNQGLGVLVDDFTAQARAQMQSASALNAASPPGELDRIAGRIGLSVSTAQHIANRTIGLRDRLLGAMPTKGEAGANVAPLPSGALFALDGNLNNLDSALSVILDALETLERL